MNIEQSIKSYILKEFLPGEDASRLTDATPLITTGILDSIATLKLVLFLEQNFGLTIQPHEVNAEYMDTISQIAELVRSKD